MNYAVMNKSIPKIFVTLKKEAVDKLGQCNRDLHDPGYRKRLVLCVGETITTYYIR
jgi:hypothetical protein